MSTKRVSDSWIAKIAMDFDDGRLLWLLGTESEPKWVKPRRYRKGERVRITVEKLPRKKKARS